MKQRVFWVAVALAVGLVAARGDDKAAGGSATNLVDQGKQIVETKKCSICHALDGKGGKLGKPFNGIAEGKTDDYLKSALLDPKKTIGADTKMPSYKDKLKDEEVKAVVEYLKTLKKP